MATDIPKIKIDEEAAKIFQLIKEGVYDSTSDVQSHIESIVNSVTNSGVKHKELFERFLFKYHILRNEQAKYFSGTRTDSQLRLCKKLEKELDDQKTGLLSLDYSIERFLSPPPTTGKFF